MNLNKWFAEVPTGIDGKPLPPERIGTLEEILHKRFGRESSIEAVNQLKSKKNTVVALKIQTQTSKSLMVVAKMFIAGRFENELAILQASWSSGLSVPKVIDAHDGVILMEFIPGDIFVDRINQTFDSNLMVRLAEWYSIYHRVHRLIKGDPRLRNFIIHNDKIIGVDFEESQQGHWMIDIAGVCASLLDTNPIFDEQKRKLCWLFLEQYLSFSNIQQNEALNTHFLSTLADTLEQTAQWRNDETILKLSEKIRAEGLPTS
jgi:tRNA A-37 threonylcarbamoyl transferase component Bud32